MKKIISILFILAMCGTFLPAVISFENQKVILFSTVEEEQPNHQKDVKEKDEYKAVFAHEAYFTACSHIPSFYPNLSILFSDDPCIGNHTPPPDSFC